MQEKLNRLKEIVGEATDLARAAAVLNWDQEVYMPEGGIRSRSQQMATLSRLAHEISTAAEAGELLDDLLPYAAELDPDSDDARLIRVCKNRYDKRVKVPAKWVAENAELTSQAYGVWAQARQENDFAKFLPYLERIFELRREYSHYFEPYEHIYDALLDDYETGMKTSEVQAIFEAMRPEQVALVKEITRQPQVDSSFLYQAFDEQKQWDFGKQVISEIGYDWQHGRIDKAPHPFTINFGNDDVRITTRVDPAFFNTAFFATLHEGGHALYERGSGDTLERTPLAGGASFGIHESQSRLWENLVGRSLPFWERYYPQLQALFPEQLGAVELKSFYHGINRVAPSLIRVEADEATYNLHIMLRMELEIAVLEGKLAVKDLPAAWNSRMQDYLGLTPPDDARGVLQDVHWGVGYIGYFPTYALGNIISAQLWEAINADIPNLPDQIRQGQFNELLGWVREKIHRHGAKFQPQELVQRVTGGKIDARPYLRYLRSKYSEIYGL